jgi:hypothetical protein
MMADHFIDDVATGDAEAFVSIRGRPRSGTSEAYVFLEEPGRQVLMHFSRRFRGGHLPHYVKDCPNCDNAESPKPFWYIGAVTRDRELCLVELTPRCFRAAEVASRIIRPRAEIPQVLDAVVSQTAGKSIFTGLLVTIGLNGGARWLRCGQRIEITTTWPYETRRELARIWGVPVKPRIYREQA